MSNSREHALQLQLQLAWQVKISTGGAVQYDQRRNFSPSPPKYLTFFSEGIRMRPNVTDLCLSQGMALTKRHSDTRIIVQKPHDCGRFSRGPPSAVESPACVSSSWEEA